MTFYTVDQLHDSKRLHCSRLSCKVQFSDHVMSFSRHNYAIMSLPAKLANKLSFLFTPRRQSPPGELARRLRYARQLILAPDVNDSGNVALFVKPKRKTDVVTFLSVW